MGESLPVEEYTFSDSYSLTIEHGKELRGEEILRAANLVIEAEHGNITHKQLMEKLGYNRDYLNRVIKMYSGMTIKEYCDFQKLKAAASRIAETDEPVAKILEELNYSGSRTFYRQFQKYFFMSPLEYRKKSS